MNSLSCLDVELKCKFNRKAQYYIIYKYSLSHSPLLMMPLEITNPASLRMTLHPSWRLILVTWVAQDVVVEVLEVAGEAVGPLLPGHLANAGQTRYSFFVYLICRYAYVFVRLWKSLPICPKMDVLITTLFIELRTPDSIMISNRLVTFG